LWLAVGLGIALVLAVAAFLLLRPAPTDDLAAAKAALTETASRLDLLTVEYPKLLAGQPNGAEAALTSAEAAFNRAVPTLQPLDPRWVTTRQTNLSGLKIQVSSHAAAADVEAAARSLIGAINTWLAAH
jgi:hypothetical protein